MGSEQFFITIHFPCSQTFEQQRIISHSKKFLLFLVVVWWWQCQKIIDNNNRTKLNYANKYMDHIFHQSYSTHYSTQKSLSLQTASRKKVRNDFFPYLNMDEAISLLNWLTSLYSNMTTYCQSKSCLKLYLNKLELTYGCKWFP